jgi:hypothetical protein
VAFHCPVTNVKFMSDFRRGIGLGGKARNKELARR